MLPKISIKVDVSTEIFLDRLEQIAKNLGNAEVKRTRDIAGFEGWQGLNLDSRLPSSHENLCGIVFSQPESADMAFIELSAVKWHPDPPPYDTYVEAARILFDPLIKGYNKKYNSRYRLSVQAKTVKKFALPPETAKRLQSFIACANKRALHPNDWNRFYQFIAFCHAHHVKLTGSHLSRLLFEGGFSKEKAEYLADIYCHGKEILALK
ncbi:MAG: hypothetical protein M0Z67_14460 [Nitrospiraceae bacterium]|nr:hypothetical protein [Nitrospiraceae bacterium]